MWLSLFVPLAVIVVAVGLEQLETMLLQRRSRAAAGAQGLPTPAAQDDGASDGRGRRGPGTRRRPP
jgi:hypothetical protein